MGANGLFSDSLIKFGESVRTRGAAPCSRGRSKVAQCGKMKRVWGKPIPKAYNWGCNNLSAGQAACPKPQLVTRRPAFFFEPC